MAISVMNAMASFEAPKQVEKPEKVEKVAKAEPSAVANAVPAAETQPVMATIGNEAGNSTAEQEKGQQQPGRNIVRTAVNHANSKLKLSKTRCEFSYHEATKRISIKVLDKDTNEVIREIPPEETLEMVEKMLDLAGILVDEKR